MRRALTAALVLALLLSVALNYALFDRLRSVYRSHQIVRIDPTGERRFEVENRQLAASARSLPRIAWFGDSRIAMWQPELEIENTQSIRRGGRGDTTAELLLRLERDVLRHEPEVVVVEAGVNELKALGVFKTRAPAVVRDCKRNLETIVRRITARGAHAVVLSVFPVGRPDRLLKTVWNEDGRRAIEDVNAHLAALAGPRVTFVDLDPQLSVAGTLNTAYARDALHLNDRGYEAVNRELGRILEAALPD